MIDLSNIKRVFVATYKVDFRKSFDGLLGEAYRMGLNPLAGDLILFLSQNGTRIKVLFCDPAGDCVLNKRLYKNERRRGRRLENIPQQTEIDYSTLAWILNGGRWQDMKKKDFQK